MNQTQYQVGDTVFIIKKELLNQKGTIQFIGNLEGKDGTYFGIALDNALGTHNGSFQGKAYFTCEDKHGIFIMEKYLKLDKPLVQKKEEPKKDDKQKLKQSAPVRSDRMKTKTTVKPKVEEKKVEEKKTEEKKVEEKPHIQKSDEKQQKQIPKISLPIQQEKQSIISEKQSEKTLDTQNQSQLENQEESQPGSVMVSPRKGQDNTELVQKIAEYEKIIKEKDEQIQDLQKQVDSTEEDRSNQKQSSSAIQMVNQDLKNQLAAMKKKCDQLEQQLASSSAEEIDTLNELAEALTLENETLKLKRDQDLHLIEKQTQEIKQLREEKELAELELEEAILTAGSVYETSEQDTGGNNQELILANGKLRQALQMLNDKLEKQQAEFDLEVAQYQQKLQSLPDLLEKQKLCAKFEKEIQNKNEIITELSTRIDDQSSLSDMVEKLAEQMLKRDDDIANLKKQIKEMNELKKLDQELVTDLEELNADQEKSIQNLEFDIYTLKNNIRTLQEEIKDKEEFINRLRSKISNLNNQLDQFKDNQLVDTISTSQPSNSKIQDLINKNSELSAQRREMYKRYLQMNISDSEMRNQVLLKGVLLLRSIPQDYYHKLKFNLIDPLSQIRKVAEKAFLLGDEFIYHVEIYGDQLIKDENSELGFWMLDAVKYLNTVAGLSLTLSSFLENWNVIVEVEKVSRNGVLINQFRMAGGQVEDLIRMVAEDSISSKESLSGLQVIIGHINEDINQLLQTYKDYKEGLEYKGVEINNKIQLIIQCLSHATLNCKLMKEQERQRFPQKEGFKMDQLVDTLLQRMKEQTKLLRQCRASWGSYESFMDKNVKQYIQLEIYLEEMCVILKDNLSFETEEAFLTGVASEEITSQQFYQTFRDRCISIAHILNLLNHKKDQDESSILDQFSSSHKNTQSNVHVFTKTSIWAQVSSEIHNQLSEITFTIESEKRLKEELETSVQDKMLMQNEIQSLKKAREALERRVVDLQLKADRVSILENEKRRYLDKIQGFNEATDLTRKELENYENKCKELEEERNQLEQLIVVYQQSSKTGKQNEAAEQLISKSSARFQSKLQKVLGDLNNASQNTFSSQNLDQEPKNTKSLQTKPVATFLRELEKVKNHEVRRLIIESTKDTSEEKENEKVNKSIYKLEQVKLKNLRCMATSKVRKDNELDQLIRQGNQGRNKSRIRMKRQRMKQFSKN